MLMIQLIVAHVTTFCNNWHHKITGHMSWGGRYLSVDEATLATVIIVAGTGFFGKEFYTQTFVTDNGYNPFRSGSTSSEWGPITLGDSLAMFSWIYSIYDTIEKLFTTLSQTSPVEGSGKTLKDAVTSLLPLIVHVVLCVYVFRACGPVNPVTTGLLCGVSFSCIALRLVVSMKFAVDSVEYRLHTLTVVMSMGALFTMTRMSECGDEHTRFADGQMALCVIGLLVASHVLAFAHALDKINGGQPLFIGEDKKKSK
jgi:hypothetical protein